ncbi:ROK family glucokinase [Paenibacillus piri]|uniref:ROK family glucokinase n=1 Tax=Paenibacillus piri TaxID=2547395 RepID=UPI0014044D11|nr:ROK family glucokinase [Paenibacillus piri]
MPGRIYYAGIDIGGTNIKAALVDQQGGIAAKLETPTSLNGYSEVCTQIVGLIGRLKATTGNAGMTVQGIGIGVPGYIDPANGFVNESPNLGWSNVALKEHMQSLTGLPVLVENDANTAALGELWQGAGSDVNDLVMITLGTGVGCGIVIDRKVVHGSQGFAGEIGHMKVKPKTGIACVCGKKGCLETTSSGLAIIRESKKAVQLNKKTALREEFQATGDLSVKQIFDAARNNDRVAMEIISEAAFYLGVALANTANLINPQKVIVGGGIAAAGQLYTDLVYAAFCEFALDIVRDHTRFVPALLGNDAGVIGSASMMKSYYQ